MPKGKHPQFQAMALQAIARLPQGKEFNLETLLAYLAEEGVSLPEGLSIRALRGTQANLVQRALDSGLLTKSHETCKIIEARQVRSKPIYVRTANGQAQASHR